jgi:hypothetical protein
MFSIVNLFRCFCPEDFSRCSWFFNIYPRGVQNALQLIGSQSKNEMYRSPTSNSNITCSLMQEKLEGTSTQQPAVQRKRKQPKISCSGPSIEFLCSDAPGQAKYRKAQQQSIARPQIVESCLAHSCSTAFEDTNEILKFGDPAGINITTRNGLGASGGYMGDGPVMDQDLQLLGEVLRQDDGCDNFFLTDEMIAHLVH